MTFKYKILSIDGGGIRGIIPAMILSEIERRTGKQISELFDLVAGTSTGGLLALGLTKPDPRNKQKALYKAEKFVEVYEQFGPQIFSDPTLLPWFRPKYESKGRQTVFYHLLGNTSIEQAVTEVFITSYDIDLRLPIFFTSNQEAEMVGNSFCKICTGFSMLDAAMATSAAPSYFKPSYLPTPQQPSGYYTLVDGGVFANNPTSLAIMEAIIAAKKAGESLELNDILVVSLGTGSLTRQFPYNDAKNWGLAKWLQPLIHIGLDGSSESVACQLEQLLPHSQSRPQQYYRFQEKLDGPDITHPEYDAPSDDLDDVSPENIRRLKFLAQKIIRDRHHDIDELCNQLLMPVKVPALV